MLKPSLKDFEHNLTSMGDECNCLVVWTSFSSALLGNWDEDWTFQSCDHFWVFQNCWHIECNTWITSSFRILNSLLEFHHLHLLYWQQCFLRPTWLHFPECLPLGGWPHHCSNLVHLDLFFCSSSMYSFQLFLIASTTSLPSMSFIVPIFGQNVPLISPVFLKRSLAFPLLLFCFS